LGIGEVMSYLLQRSGFFETQHIYYVHTDASVLFACFNCYNINNHNNKTTYTLH